MAMSLFYTMGKVFFFDKNKSKCVHISLIAYIIFSSIENAKKTPC